MLDKSFTEILDTLDTMSNEEKYNVCRIAIRAFNNIAESDTRYIDDEPSAKEIRIYKTDPIIIFDDEAKVLENLKYRRITRKENGEDGIL